MKYTGLPSFLLKTTLDDSWEILEARFGLKGFAIMVKLLSRIYGIEGYYAKWNKDICDVFSAKNRVKAELVSDIVDFGLKYLLFDLDKFNSQGILTSASIQEHFLSVNHRKTKVPMIDVFICANFTKSVYKNLIIVDTNGKIANTFNTMELNGMELNRTECNVKELKQLAQYFLTDFNKILNDTEIQLLKNLIEMYGINKVTGALREAVAYEAKEPFSYMRKVLDKEVSY